MSAPEPAVPATLLDAFHAALEAAAWGYTCQEGEMEMGKHTPGTWEARFDQFRPYVTATSPSSGGHPITVADCCHPVDALHSHQREANARLIAAGPMLLEACRVYADRCPMCNADMECQDDLCFQMRAALAAATGEGER